MTDVHVLRVFTDAAGNHGNRLGVLFHTEAMSDAERQAVAATLGYSETVFVDDPATASLRIFTPAKELPLAGHPLVGTAWLLGKTANGAAAAVPAVRGSGGELVLRPQKASPVAAWQDGEGATWIRARVDDAPEWGFVQVESPAAVEALPLPPGPEYGHHSFWAWIDEDRGIVRARVFASFAGVPEDPATGSAALRMTAMLGRPLTIIQGTGCVIRTRPGRDGYAEVGGFVAEDPMRFI